MANPLTGEMFPWDRGIDPHRLPQASRGSRWWASNNDKICLYIDPEVKAIFRALVSTRGGWRINNWAIPAYFRRRGIDMDERVYQPPGTFSVPVCNRERVKFNTSMDKEVLAALRFNFPRSQLGLVYGAALREYFEFHLGPLSEYLARLEAAGVELAA
jgi:hypothetical protein